MDSKFFNTLKSIAAVEKSHGFLTVTYDVTTLELKYPLNVISVAPPVGQAPPPLLGETRVTRLTDAVFTAFRRARNGGANGRIGCSVVVHEGVYVDGFDKAWKFPADFSLEIVGVENVRLILETLDSIQMESLNMTLRNALIFDCRLDPRNPTAFTKGMASSFQHNDSTMKFQEI